MLITNPFASSTDDSGREELAAALAPCGTLDVEPTRHRGHALELGARAAEEGYDAVVVHGGDGSVNETVNGILGTPDREGRPDSSALPAVGVVPGGNANVFARALGVASDPGTATSQLVAGLGSGNRRTVGLGHTLNRWFLFNAGMGMDAIVIRRIDEQRNEGKKVTDARYLTTAVSSFFSSSYPSPSFTVEVPGRDPVEGVRFGFVSNTGPWTYLGARAIHTNPGTDFDHGLGLFAATSLSAWRNIGLAAQLLTGADDPKAGHLVRDDDVEWVRFVSDGLADVQMDGEYLGTHSELEFSCGHGVLDVVATPSF